MSFFQDTYHRARRNARKVVVGTAIIATGGVVVAAPWESSTAVTANAWVDTNGGTCSYNASPATYSDAAACSTMQAALNAIGSGKGNTTVKFRPGLYSGQTVSDDARATGDRVTFSENGGDASFDYLDIHGDNITVNGVDTMSRAYRTVDYSEGVSISGSSTQSKGVRLVNVIAGGGVYLSNTNLVSITGGEACCTMATATHDQKALYTDGGGGNSNVTLDGVAIHDARRNSGSVHTECAFLMSPQTLMIRNSRFYNCAVYNVSLGRIGGNSDPSGVTFENNTFEPSDDVTAGGEGGIYGIVLDHVTTRYGNLVFRNNSFSQPIQFESADTPAGAFDQTSFYSNILHGGSCGRSGGSATPVYRYNILDISGCGGTGNTVVANSLTNYTATSGTWSFLLVPGASAINAGDPANSTATDITGASRDGSPDAGAYKS